MWWQRCGTLSGKAVDELKDNPLPGDALKEVYKGVEPTDHFRNFFDSATARMEPVSDVFSHVQAMATCHLSAIAARLGRTIKWDPKAESIVGDDEASKFFARTRREGFEIHQV